MPHFTELYARNLLKYSLTLELPTVGEVHKLNTRQAAIVSTIYPLKVNKQIFKHSSTYLAVTIFNSLPDNIKLLYKNKSFKKEAEKWLKGNKDNIIKLLNI